VLGQRVVRIGARNLENAVVNHYYSQRAECDTRKNDDLIHVVKAKTARLFDPIFDERIAQSVFGFRLGEIRAFDDETIFAHFFGLLSGRFMDRTAAGYHKRHIAEHKKHISENHLVLFVFCYVPFVVPVLPHAGVLSIQRFAQAREVRIE